MKAQLVTSRDYPHAITSVGLRKNLRWPVIMSNTPVADPGDGSWVIAGPGMLDPKGEPTARGKRALDRAICERARTSQAHYCIVWSEQSCIYLLPDGSVQDSQQPPQGEFAPDDPAWDRRPVKLEGVSSLPIAGRGPQFLCLKRTGEFVEVMPGARVVLGDFGDYPPGCKDDPAADLRDASGKWKTPLFHRGQPVSKVTSNGVLLGPVQPDDVGGGIILRAPWPHELEAACNQVAGRRLPKALLRQAWAAIDPRAESCALRDLLEAA